jgi:Tfp pilus assembly protein PilN
MSIFSGFYFITYLKNKSVEKELALISEYNKVFQEININEFSLKHSYEEFLKNNLDLMSVVDTIVDLIPDTAAVLEISAENITDNNNLHQGSLFLKGWSCSKKSLDKWLEKLKNNDLYKNVEFKINDNIENSDVVFFEINSKIKVLPKIDIKEYGVLLK